MSAPSPTRAAAWLLALAFLLAAPQAPASSLVPTTEEQDFSAANGVCRGRVSSVQSFRPPGRGGIHTRARIDVLESIKGSFPKSITIIQRGGLIDGEGDSNGLAVDFRPGDEFLLHVAKRPDGTLAIPRGYDGATLLSSKSKPAPASASKKLQRLRQLASAQPASTASILPAGEDFASIQGTDLASSSTPPTTDGLLADSTYGVPARFIAPDRGEPIGYLVDTAILPSGISEQAALEAIANAFAAWSAETGIAFRFDGLENFGMAPADVAINDGRIRIALHDSYGDIPSPTTLGIGGRSFAIAASFTATGGDGGAVDGLEFRKTNRGYIVLQHTATTLQNPTSLEEVLCHEIGHVLGMSHSSEDPSETDPLLKEAIMYYRVHKDGRGASLGTYDIPVVQKAHPPDDTPPFSDDRILTLVTAPTPISGIPGVNEVLLGANDLQSPSPTLTLVTDGPEAGSAATSSFDGHTLRITQRGYYADNSVDPAGNSYFHQKHVRFSDGPNLSPWTRVRVVALRLDSQGDGLPNSWSTTHFGSPTPSSANLSRPGDDPDGDGFTNLDEFLLGTNPVDASSRLAIDAFDGTTLTWTATPHALYTLESSTDLATWTPLGLPLIPTTTTADVITPSSPDPQKFLRIRFGHAP